MSNILKQSTCKEPNYLCCDDDPTISLFGWTLPSSYSCDPCDECCDQNDAVSSDGKSIPCPDYCGCHSDQPTRIYEPFSAFSSSPEPSSDFYQAIR